MIESQGNVNKNQSEVFTITENDMQNSDNSKKKDTNDGNNDLFFTPQNFADGECYY